MPDPISSRRRFGGALAAATLATALPAQAARRHSSPMKLIKPPRLREGDLIGLISPSGHTSDESIAKAVATIEGLGFKVALAPHLREVMGNYAGPVAHRRHSPRAEQAVVTSTLVLWRSIGTVLGVASSSLVVQNALLFYLEEYVHGPDKEAVSPNHPFTTRPPTPYTLSHFHIILYTPPSDLPLLHFT